MVVPARCPSCGATDIRIVSLLPSDHSYDGWQTAIRCPACETETLAVEIDQ